MLEMTFSPQKGSLIYPSSLSNSVCGHTLGKTTPLPPPLKLWTKNSFNRGKTDSNVKNNTKCQIRNIKIKITWSQLRN